MRLLLLWLGAATLTRAAHFQDDWVMEYPRPSGAQDSPDADLAIRVDFSSLKGPGQRLLNGIAMGVTSCVEINQCVGCTRQFFTKSFLGDDAAVLAPSSGKEPASSRHRAGVASMAWRTTR